MKITLREEEKEVFKKKYLNLVFETQEEYDSFLAMCKTHTSVPEAVCGSIWGGECNEGLLNKMLLAIFSELEE